MAAAKMVEAMRVAMRVVAMAMAVAAMTMATMAGCTTGAGGELLRRAGREGGRAAGGQRWLLATPLWEKDRYWSISPVRG